LPEYKTSPTGNKMQSNVRVPVAEEFWRTLDGPTLAIADMSEDHVRNALRYVICKTRYRKLLRDMLVLEKLTDSEIDFTSWCWL